MATHKGLDDILFAAIRDIAAVPTQYSKERLGHFSMKQVGLSNTLLQPYGQVPWNELINPLWSKLPSYVEEELQALDSVFIHPDKESFALLSTLIDDRTEFPRPVEDYLCLQ